MNFLKWGHLLNYNPTADVNLNFVNEVCFKALFHFQDRISAFLLNGNLNIPKCVDIIWMCQLLDCFLEDEILKILKIAANSMDDSTELIIVKIFTDRQIFKRL